MNLVDLANFYNKHDHSKELSSFIESKKEYHVLLKGLHGSSASLFSSSIIKKISKPHLFIISDKEKAAYFQNDLKELFPKRDILFFPSSYKRSAFKSEHSKLDDGSLIMRTEVLNSIQDCS